MQLYVWTNYAPGWREGLAFAIANNVDEARAMIRAKYNDDLPKGLDLDPPNLNLDPDVYPLDRPIAFECEGGD